MKSKVGSTGQTSGTSNKKSVFDRLGQQLDAENQMKRRPSPGQHGEYMPPPPPMHEPDYGRYGRESQAEMEWRYQQERRHMPPFPRDRHPMQLAPPPPQPPHYEMEMDRGPYYPQHPHPYHDGPPGPLPPMGPGNMGPMNMIPQRTSPKYDRHGNVIVGFKGERPGQMMRMGPMEHHHAMSPPRNFMPNQMMGPMHPPHEMSPMRFPHHRWPENMEPDFPPHGGNPMMPPMEGGFNPMMDSRRFPPQQPQQQMMNPLLPPGPNQPGGEFPRYARWRERRDVITNLDRETAQSSSRTDSLKSTLQQQQLQSETRIGSRNEFATNNNLNTSSSKSNLSTQANSKNSKASTEKKNSKSTVSSSSEKDANTTKETDKTKVADKTEPQDISDGEIVDDEDSSDDSEIIARSEAERHATILAEDSYLSRSMNHPAVPYGRVRESHSYYEPIKKRRMHEREDYAMDYETISDDDLDDFMEDKKISELSPSEAKLAGRLDESEGKSLSEIELLNALGLDWANLVEMARQSKSSGKDSSSSGTALTRFSLLNYLPTLCIAPDLVGPEIYDLILRACRA